MKDIHKLFNILPIYVNSMKLNLLSLSDIDWYVDNCRKEYYEKFLDCKFSSDITRDRLRDLICNMVISYELKINNQFEARLILKNDNSDIVGGCTLFQIDKLKTMELAYFIVPEYQRQGIATNMIINVCDALRKSEMKLDKIILKIQEDNVASKNTAIKAGFKLLTKEKGRFKTNIIMYKTI